MTHDLVSASSGMMLESNDAIRERESNGSIIMIGSSIDWCESNVQSQV